MSAQENTIRAKVLIVDDSAKPIDRKDLLAAVEAHLHHRGSDSRTQLVGGSRPCGDSRPHDAN